MDRRIVELLLLERGVKSICKELHVGKERVREVREKARAFGYIDGSMPLPPAPSPLFPDPIDGRTLKTSEQDRMLALRLDWIKDRIVAGWKPITIFEELGTFGVSRSSFYRFFDRHALYKLLKNVKEPSLVAPIVHEPGEALILDWGKLCDVEDPVSGKERTLWAFVGVLGFSRYMMVRLVWSNDIPTTLEAIESMLKEIGGVPRRMTTDNPKCFADKADKYDPKHNLVFDRFAEHYGFVIECLPPREPKKKGKVERLMPFVRRLFEARPDFTSIENWQTYMDKKAAIANERRHGTTCQKPITVFVEKEAQALKPLPTLAYERCEVSYPTVRRDGFVRYANKYYAVADKFIGEEMMVLATKAQVSIFFNGRLVELYERLTRPDDTHAIKDHLKKAWQKIEDNNLHYVHMAAKIGPEVSRFVHMLLARGNGFVDTRRIWGVLSLEKKYSKESINFACGIAIELDKLSSRFVEEMIQLHHVKPAGEITPADVKPAASVEKPHTSKFARPMSVYKEQLSLLLH
jgi:hypothetical protein